MRYLCVHCDKVFDVDGDKAPRCPTCMRKNGMELIAEPVASKSVSSSRMPWAVAGGFLLAAVVAYGVWSQSETVIPEGDVVLEPLDRESTLAYLNRYGVDARDLNDLMLPNDAVAALAADAPADGVAQAVYDAIRERAAAGAFVPWSIGVPRERLFASTHEVSDWIGEDDAEHHLYPLEVATLMAAALRSRDVPAMVAELQEIEGARTPPDPSGQFGYYVVAVYDAVVNEDVEPTLFDPYGGQTLSSATAPVLNDMQVIGAALGHRALHLLVRDSEPDRAIETSEQALELFRTSATLRAVRGAILLAGGRTDEGLREFESAMQLRPDAPRRNLVAGVQFALRDIEAASRQISAALEESPDFAPGLANRAMVHLARGEMEDARASLEQAERVDPNLHNLPQLWANYFATTGDLNEAARRAGQAVERNPADVQSHLLAGRIFRQLGDYDRMRREAQAVLSHTPSSREPEMRELIRQMLGATALEPIDETDPLEDTSDSDPLDEVSEDDELRLDVPLLGGSESGGPNLLGGDGDDGPSLLGDDSPLGGGLLGGSGGGPSLLGGGQGSGGGLRLNLGN